MGRPRLDTDELRAALAVAGGLGEPLPQLRARLERAGHSVSRSTLARLRARERASTGKAPRSARTPAPAAAPVAASVAASAAVAELEHAAAEAVELGGLDALKRTQASVQRAIDEQVRFAGSEARAAQSAARLIDCNCQAAAGDRRFHAA